MTKLVPAVVVLLLPWQILAEFVGTKSSDLTPPQHKDGKNAQYNLIAEKEYDGGLRGLQQQLEGFGGEPDTSRYPLKLCQGDCDDDSECEEGLYCFQRGPSERVPGCIGGEQNPVATDYCVVDPNYDGPVTVTTDNGEDEDSTTLTLKPITWLGSNGNPQSAFPLPLCAGDCDWDSDCEDGLICFQRDRFEPVPGCSQGESDSSPTDYCIDPAMTGNDGVDTDTEAPSVAIPTEPTLAPSFQESLEAINQPQPTTIPTFLPTIAPSFAETTEPPARDPTSEPTVTETTSEPTSRGSTMSPTFTETTASPTFTETKTLIIDTPRPTRKPTPKPVAVVMSTETTPKPTPPPTRKSLEFVGNDRRPRHFYPLLECQGDCDDDDDCDVGLYCYQRDAGEPVPGCSGFDEDGNDYCVPLPEFPFPGTFRLKMYWEPGYLWQEEDFERRWCATFDYDGSPENGKCWYDGDDARECRWDHMYIDECKNDYRQRFTFENLPNSEVLIKLGDGTDWCWERFEREVRVRECDPTNVLQRWFAPNGSFDGPRFEISQRDYDRQCVSVDHHPKPGEVVETHSCNALRKLDSQTSYWNKW